MKLTEQVAKNIIRKLLKGDDYRIEVVTQFENIKHSCENEVNGRLVINTLNGIFYHTIVEAANAANMSVTAFGKRLSGSINNNTPYQYA